MYRIRILGTDQATASMEKEEIYKAGAELRKAYVEETVFVVQKIDGHRGWADWRMLEDF